MTRFAGRARLRHHCRHGLAWEFCKRIMRVMRASDPDCEAAFVKEQHVSSSPAGGRLRSLDVFRGMTLGLMVLVNNPGNPTHAYSALKHAGWNGWTPTDLIYPFFIFIVGVAVPYSLEHRLASGVGYGRLHLQIVQRSLLLFGLGLVLNGFPDYHLGTLRIMGILQRIAICYFVASVLYLRLKGGVAIVAGAILVSYFVLMKYVPVPGVGAGVLEPVGNWGQYIDSHLMPGHLGAKTWEGKSLLGTVSAVATALIGVVAGQCLRSSRLGPEKVVLLFFGGNLAMFAGSVWDRWFPINQNLWSSSFVLWSGGMGLVLLAACYWVVDERKLTWWTWPFVVLGSNSLLLWTGTTLGRRTLEVIKMPGAHEQSTDLKTWIWESIFAPWAGRLHGSELFAVTYVLIWFGVLAILYRRRVFLRL